MKQMVLLVVLIFLTACTSIPTEKQCSADKDCVPNACCHATDAVNRAHIPNCSSALCTMDCKPSTLDCGQGELKCVAGECKVVLQ